MENGQKGTIFWKVHSSFEPFLSFFPSFLPFFLFLETGSHYVAQASLEFMLNLP
jgi:hypothetical protein